MYKEVFCILGTIVGIFAQPQPGVPGGGGFTGTGVVNPALNTVGGVIPGFQPGTVPGVAGGPGFMGPPMGPQPFTVGRPFAGVDMFGGDMTGIGMTSPQIFADESGLFDNQLGSFTFDPSSLGFDTSGFGSVLSPSSPLELLMRRVALNPNNYRYATCVFNDTWSPVRGRVDMRQFLIGEGRQQVSVRIQLSGLPQSVGEVERGIHVHEFGDIGQGCARVGPHFNPNQTPHGSRRNFAFLRHVGNLGNIRQSREGLVSTQFVDSVISLEGVNNVVGRAIAIKFERDDEGMGGTRDSQVNGNTHTPIACCTIGRTTARNWYNPLSVQDIQNMAQTGIMPYYTVNQNVPGTGLNMGTNPNMVSAGTQPGAAQFGTGTFVPGQTGQTFNFAAQGKK